jgi:hypothetical protein
VIANQDAQVVEGEYEEIEEGIHASSRYSSFLNKKKSKAWSIEETRLFYKVQIHPHATAQPAPPLLHSILRVFLH